MTKLEQLADAYDMEIMEILEEASMDSVCPAICTNKNCDYVDDLEPDQDAGFCEDCKTNTVKSALILAGLI